MKNIAIILSSGNGNRMNIKIPKQYIRVDNKPIICYSIDKFEKCSCIDEIIIVCSDEYIQFFKNIIIEYNYIKIKKIVVGGKERMHSVYNGIMAIENPCENIVIHDGVRPFIKEKYIKKIIEKTNINKACVLAVKAKDTIKICRGNIVEYTPNRNNLWIIQTPQSFKYNIIKKAYENAIKNKYNATDDASVVEFMGKEVYIVEGDYENIKITTKDDLKMFFGAKITI